MFDADPKFFNEDGSIDYETALAAGRMARAAAFRHAIAACGSAVARACRLFRAGRVGVSPGRLEAPRRDALASQQNETHV